LSNHTHTGGNHTHDLSNHTHTVNAHSHTVNSHNHDFGTLQFKTGENDATANMYMYLSDGSKFPIYGQSIGNLVAGAPSFARFSNAFSQLYFTKGGSGVTGSTAPGTNSQSPGTSGPSNNNTGSAGAVATSGPNINATGSAGSLATSGPNNNNSGAASPGTDA